MQSIFFRGKHLPTARLANGKWFAAKKNTRTGAVRTGVFGLNKGYFAENACRAKTFCQRQTFANGKTICRGKSFAAKN